MIFGGELRVLQDQRIEDFQAPMSQALGAAWEAAWTRNPASSYLRAVDAEVAKYNPDGWVGADDARQRVAEAGLNLNIPDEGMGQRGLDLLIQTKSDEVRRERILARAPRGAGPGTALFLTGLGASVLDPINVAASFIPVVGEARFARLLEAAGESTLARAGVRAGVGAARGVAGAGLVEPIVYAEAQREQADYGLANSMLNIVFGAAMGAGLHAGMGALADRLDAISAGKQAPELAPTAKALTDLPMDVRETAFRAAVAHEMEGRPAHVEQFIRPILDFVPRDIEGAPAHGPVEVRMAARIREIDAALAEKVTVEPAQIKAWQREIDSLMAERGRLMDERYTPATLRAASTREVRQSIHSQYVARRRRLDAIKDRAEAVAALREHTLKQTRESRTHLQQTKTQLLDLMRQTAMGRLLAEPKNLGLPVGPPGRNLIRGAVDAVTKNDQRFAQENHAAARQVAAPESSRIADFEASKIADTKIAEAPKEYTTEEATAALADEEAALRDLEAATGRDFAGELEASAEEIKDANGMAKALGRIAGCNSVFR